MELQDLVGKHVLTAVSRVETVELPPQYEYSEPYHGETFSFVLDGVTYTAREDESDGYRSSMRDIVASDTPLSNTFPPEEVVGRIRTEGEYGQDDVLELVSVATGEVVLEVGTENVDDYYPAFVAGWWPERLSCNRSVPREGAKT